MQGPEYRSAITKLGLSINAAGRFFQVGSATAHRWVKDGPPSAVSMLLTLMLKLHASPSWVNYWLGRKDDDDEDQ